MKKGFITLGPALSLPQQDDCKTSKGTEYCITKHGPKKSNTTNNGSNPHLGPHVSVCNKGYQSTSTDDKAGHICPELTYLIAILQIFNKC